MEVTLIPSGGELSFEQARYDVFAADGTALGQLVKYTGSIDTKIKGTRLRREGRRRTLWKAESADRLSFMSQRETRADALRALIGWAGR